MEGFGSLVAPAAECLSGQRALQKLEDPEGSWVVISGVASTFYEVATSHESSFLTESYF